MRLDRHKTLADLVKSVIFRLLFVSAVELLCGLAIKGLYGTTAGGTPEASRREVEMLFL